MSGFSSLANWALSGGAGGNNNNNDDEGNNNNQSSTTDPPGALTEDEIRARRMARIEAMQRRQQEVAAAVAATAAASPSQGQDTQPMEVDDEANEIPKASAMTSPSSSTSSAVTPMDTSADGNPITPSQNQPASKKVKASSPSNDAARLQRKKELLIKKVMHITLGAARADPACIPIQVDDPTVINTATIAEIFANRLALPTSALNATVPAQKALIQYLATCYRKAADEAKTLRQVAQKKQQKQDSSPATQELEAIVEEIQSQAINYAASSLMVPELFEQSANAHEQLRQALVQSANGGGDLQASLLFAVAGKDSSFYHKFCTELFNQDADAFTKVVLGLVTSLANELKALETLQDGVGPSSALGLVTTLTAVCSHKEVAKAVTTKLDAYNAAASATAAAKAESNNVGCRFLAPPEGSPAASEKVPAPAIPPGPPGEDMMRRMIRLQRHQTLRPAYLKRSGVFLERGTLLGLALRISTPREDTNGPFKPSSVYRLAMSSAAEGQMSIQRNQLKVYQTACQQLVTNLLKGGKVAQGAIMTWFADFLKLNEGATAYRPNPAKVSSEGLLLNTSNCLLKLCNPFTSDETKHNFINLGFVSDAAANRGVFPTQGDEALRRLGGGAEEESGGGNGGTPYNPTNTFIPQAFFYCARSLALGIVPALTKHETLGRQISHHFWDLRNRNQDPQSSQRLLHYMMLEKCMEIALFQEDMVVDTLRFCNLMAQMLVDASDEELRRMPEFFVDNVCDIMTGIASDKPKLLGGLSFGHVFQMVVKLLSPNYAQVVTNYNLRAKLGDVLFELYLPVDTTDRRHRREVPPSVTCDPTRGGQTYLLSDPAAQETLAPSLLLLYGEVEHTGFYEKMGHRAKICKLIKFLWESSEHRPAFRRITANQDTFIVFANGIMNEQNTLIGDVMQKLPEIRASQLQMENVAEWGRLSEEEQNRISEALEENERAVKSSLPLVNQTLAMFAYLNTDEDIRRLFLLPDLLPRLVGMLNHTSSRLVGRQGLELKVCRISRLILIRKRRMSWGANSLG